MSALSRQPDASLETFSALDLRVGVVAAAEAFPEARKPSYKLWIDFGELGMRTSSAQITALYSPMELVGRQVVCAVNLGTRRIAAFESQVLTLGVDDGGGNVVLLAPERPVPPGHRIY
jgi:tRNA-binding protein